MTRSRIAPVIETPEAYRELYNSEPPEWMFEAQEPVKAGVTLFVEDGALKVRSGERVTTLVEKDDGNRAPWPWWRRKLETARVWVIERLGGDA